MTRVLPISIRAEPSAFADKARSDFDRAQFVYGPIVSACEIDSLVHWFIESMIQ